MMLMPRRNFDLFDDDFFKDDFFNEKGKSNFNLMKTDIQETDHSYLLDVDLPGYNREDIKVDVTDGYLNIQAKSEKEDNEEKNGTYVRRERFTGQVSRSFYVGDDVDSDNIKATFRNGILSLEVPKVDSDKKEDEKKYIEIGE